MIDIRSWGFCSSAISMGEKLCNNCVQSNLTKFQSSSFWIAINFLGNTYQLRTSSFLLLRMSDISFQKTKFNSIVCDYLSLWQQIYIAQCSPTALMATRFIVKNWQITGHIKMLKLPQSNYINQRFSQIWLTTNHLSLGYSFSLRHTSQWFIPSRFVHKGVCAGMKHLS